MSFLSVPKSVTFSDLEHALIPKIRHYSESTAWRSLHVDLKCQWQNVP